MVMNAFVEGSERNRALGTWGGIGGFGATAGLLLGGLITDTLGWQWIFWINVPFGVLRSRSLVGGDLLLWSRAWRSTACSSSVWFGLMAGVMTVAAVVGALVCQRVVTRIGVRPVATVGTALLGGACLLLTRVVSEHSSPQLLTLALLVFGAGMGTATACAQIVAFTGVAERHSGLAAGRRRRREQVRRPPDEPGGHLAWPR